MTDDTERLWLAHTVGRSDDPTGRLVTEEPIPRRKSNAMFHLLFLHDQTLGRPQVTVGSPYPAISMDANIKLDLTPLLFEYLCRIAAGSLPSSFSRQCQQEVKYFARIVRQQIATLLQSQDIDLNQIRVLSLNDDASIKAKDIKVIVA